ncbi:ATP synthase F1 subunit delta [Rubinisphaera margarita]|uniref:ATP synthase F1 subunit delta n=1 Tax=Rubinisphaera margarita TaxID=2909586 RepID=UPI001EE841FA|nr:ATP synthase F1 subunit delta [Rubinisphaera margarita]MCG6157557.1 ATP synthase F1 subunit delta [Rubinisphaera margarita]
MIDSTDKRVRVPNVLEDPSMKAIAQVYADGFLDASGEPSGDGRVDEFRSFIHDILDPHPEFERKLVSPMVPVEAKIGLLERTVFPHASQVFASFLKVLAHHERLDLVRVIFDVCADEQMQRAGRRKVTVRSATSIPDDKLEQIRQHLANFLAAEPVLQVEIDPSLLGGLVIQVGDTVYDSSLRNRLGQLRSQLRQRYVNEIQSGRNRFSHSEGS